jgi:hypothetical protein
VQIPSTEKETTIGNEVKKGKRGGEERERKRRGDVKVEG